MLALELISTVHVVCDNRRIRIQHLYLPTFQAFANFVVNVEELEWSPNAIGCQLRGASSGAAVVASIDDPRFQQTKEAWCVVVVSAALVSWFSLNLAYVILFRVVLRLGGFGPSFSW